MSQEFWLAFEGGGSKTRILLARPEGDVVQREVGGSSSRLYIDPVDYTRTICDLLDPIQKTVAEQGGRVTAAGLAGPIHTSLVREILEGQFGAIDIACFGEVDVALAMYDLQAGIGVVAGTGSCCRSINEQGIGAWCGGFGPQFGDEGSGYWIGRQAMRAVMLSRDGRGPTTSLLMRFFRYMRVPNPLGTLRYAQGTGHMLPPQVAAFTPHVFDAAREGDLVALRICREAGREIADLVLSTARKSGIKVRPIPLVLTGGVFNGGDLIVEPLKHALSESEIEFEVHPPVPEPAEGIIRMLQRRQQRRGTCVS